MTQKINLTWLRGVTVALLAAALYANTLSNELVNDDVPAIVANPAVQTLDLRQIFGTASWSSPASPSRFYRPLVTLSFAVNHALGGLHPLGYHAGNLLLHALAGVLVYALLLRLGGGAAPAWAAALLFAAHPINTEAVTAVVGRAELMAALAVLVALWVDARSYATGRLGVMRGGAVAAAFACGLLSKETAVTLIPALVVTDLAVRCRWDWRAFVVDLRGSRGRLYGTLLLVLAGYLLLRWGVGVRPPENPGMNPLGVEPAPIRLLNALVIAGRYLWLLVLPWRLSADYMVGAVPIIRTLWDWRVAASALAILACCATGVLAVRRQPLVAWAILFAVCTYSLVSNVLFALPAMMGERWLYLPAVGFCTVLAFAGAAILARVAAPWRRTAGAVLVAVILLGYGTRTVLRNRDWHDFVSLWSATLRVVPGSFKAREGLAYGYAQQGRFDEAAPLLEEARRIYGDDARTYTLLGEAYVRLGKLDEAIQTYQDLLARVPNAVDVRYQIGHLYLQQHRYADAARELTEATKLAPGVAFIYTELGKAYYFDKNLGPAAASFERALELAPDLPEALVGRAACAHAQGNYDEAVRGYLTALAKGEPPNLHLRVSIEGALTAYAQMGPDSAVAVREHATQALRYFPDSPTLQKLAAGQG